MSLSADIKGKDHPNNYEHHASLNTFDRTVYKYLSLRAGFGNNVLSTAYNDTKGVYTISGEYGIVINNTFKLGGGLHYRFYQHYYDYIKDYESLVRAGNEFDHFTDDPWRYATNFGIYVTAEFLLNHFGLDFNIGYNFHKPAYAIDWRINQGWDNAPRELPDFWVFGELDSQYKQKKAISTRMGIKYYLIGTKNAPTHNIYLGFHIKTNLGQADFTDLSLGYVYKLNKSEK